MASLKYVYNKRLLRMPNINGSITVKWAIDEFGKVLFAKVVRSTLNDRELEKIISQKIRRWALGKIDKSGNVTEVIYHSIFYE